MKLDDITKNKSPPWLDGIEGDAARELIESDDAVIRVISGPGSGKTTCLQRRVRRLVEKNGVDPKTIFVGTFTRAVAEELRERLKKVHVSTLHSLAYKLLREYPDARQNMQLRFLLKYEEDTLLYDVGQNITDIGNIYKLREALHLLQASQAKRMAYEHAPFAGAVRDWLQHHHGMLIGEVGYICVTSLESEDIPLGMFDHVIIDEYQDLTLIEQELVELMWSKRGSLVVMGDDDQSIYEFRFSHPGGITDFKINQFEFQDLSFPDNRRCGKQILDFANIMMAQAGSKKPPMKFKSDKMGTLNAVQWPTLDDEIEGLAKHIKRTNESFLVLVPRRFIGYRLADEIGADAQTAFTEQVLEHPIAQESFTALSFLSASDDFVSVRAWLGLHKTKREYVSCRNADAYASFDTDVGGHKLLHLISKGEIDVTGKGQSHIKQRAKSAINLIERGMTPKEAINFLFDEALAGEEKDDEKRRRLADNLCKLQSAAHEILMELDSADLAEVVNQLRYRIATRAPLHSEEQDNPRVRIMTLHSAKGLEADNVVIAGVADQFIPGEVSYTTSLAEQRRLLYVSVTRAKDSLVISWPRLVRMSDMMKNQGKMGSIITKDGVRWTKTSRCSLLPQGFSGVISGKKFLGTTREG